MNEHERFPLLPSGAIPPAHLMLLGNVIASIDSEAVNSRIYPAPTKGFLNVSEYVIPSDALVIRCLLPLFQSTIDVPVPISYRPSACCPLNITVLVNTAHTSG